MKVDVVLSFVAYFLLDALVIQVMHMLTGNKLNKKGIIVFFLILNSCITIINLIWSYDILIAAWHYRA